MTIEITFRMWCLLSTSPEWLSLGIQSQYSDKSLEKFLKFTTLSGCKENHFYSLPEGQAEASIY